MWLIKWCQTEGEPFGSDTLRSARSNKVTHSPSWIHIKVLCQSLSPGSIIFLIPFLIFVFLTGGSPSLPPLPPFFSRYLFWGVNTHAKLLSLSSVTAATARQRNTIHDRVVQIAQCFRLPSRTRRGRGEAREIGWVKKKKKKREGKKKEEEVESCWRVRQRWLATRTMLVWLSGPLGFNPFDIAWVPSMCQCDSVLVQSEARAATLGRGGDLERL